MKKRIERLLLFAIAIFCTGKTEPKGNSEYTQSNTL